MIHANRDDIVAAFIFSRAPPEISGTELVVCPDHPEFSFNGLKTSSVIRFDKVTTVSRDLVEGEIGEIAGSLIKEGNEAMSRVFHL